MKFILFTALFILPQLAYSSPCDGNHDEKCSLWVFQNKELSSKEKLNYYLKACESGHLPSCTMAGYEIDIKGDKNRAISLYELSCNDDSKHGCYFLGSLYYKLGNGVKAKEALSKVCAMDDRDACFIIGKIESNSALQRVSL